MKIRVARNDVVIGEYEVGHLREMVREGIILATDKVFVTKSRDWKAISEIPELVKILFQEKPDSLGGGKAENSSPQDEAELPDSLREMSEDGRKPAKYLALILAIAATAAVASVFIVAHNSASPDNANSPTNIDSIKPVANSEVPSEHAIAMNACSESIQGAVKRINESWSILMPELKAANKITNNRIHADRIAEIFEPQIELRQDVLDQLSGCGSNVDRDSLVSFIRNEQRYFRARVNYIAAEYDQEQSLYRCPRGNFGCRGYQEASRERDRCGYEVNRLAKILRHQCQYVSSLGITQDYKNK